MVEYLCHRCGYNTNKKSNINQHLNRKKICKPILSDISIEDIKNHYNLETSVTSKITSNNSNLGTNKKLKNTEKNINNNQCFYCCKNFSRIDNLNRHLKMCKIKKKTEKETEKKTEIETNKIELLEKEISELKKYIDKIENIVEDLSYDLKECISLNKKLRKENRKNTITDLIDK